MPVFKQILWNFDTKEFYHEAKKIFNLDGHIYDQLAADVDVCMFIREPNLIG